MANHESDQLAFLELCDRAEIRGGVDGMRRYCWVTRYLRCPGHYPYPMVTVPEEFVGHEGAEPSYRTAEAVGFRAAMEDDKRARERVKRRSK
jgi:hypothetical protein